MDDSKQIARIMYWVNLAKIPEPKMRNIIYEATGRKTKSRKNLSYSDYLEVISRLRKAWISSQEYLRGKNMRAKIIVLMCSLGYKTNDNLPDYDRMHVFFEKHGVVKKAFSEMTFNELQKTVNQVTMMAKKAKEKEQIKEENDLDE